MASITEEFSGECFDFDRLSESRLGGIVLKREQKQAVANLMDGKDVLAVLPTGFGKSLIYQSFVLAKEMEESSAGCSRQAKDFPLAVKALDFQGKSPKLQTALKSTLFPSE